MIKLNPKDIAVQYMYQYNRYQTGAFDTENETVFTDIQMKSMFLSMRSDPNGMVAFFGESYAHVLNLAHVACGGDPNKIIECLSRYNSVMDSMFMMVIGALTEELMRPAEVVPAFIIDDGFDNYKHPSEASMNLEFALPDWDELNPN